MTFTYLFMSEMVLKVLEGVNRSWFVSAEATQLVVFRRHSKMGDRATGTALE